MGWKERRLEGLDLGGLEGMSIGRDGSGRRCWKWIGKDRNWKGWKGHRLLLTLLLIVSIDVIVGRCCC